MMAAICARSNTTYNFQQNKSIFMILVSTIGVFLYARDSVLPESTLDIALWVKSNMVPICASCNNKLILYSTD